MRRKQVMVPNEFLIFVVIMFIMFVFTAIMVVKNILKIKQLRADKEKTINALLTQGFVNISDKPGETEWLKELLIQLESGLIPVDTLDILIGLKKESSDGNIYISDISKNMKRSVSGSKSSANRTENINVLLPMNFSSNGLVYIRPKLAGFIENLLGMMLPHKPVSGKFGSDFEKVYVVYFVDMPEEHGVKILSGNVREILMKNLPAISGGDCFFYRTIAVGTGAISIMERQDWRETSIKELLKFGGELAKAVEDNIKELPQVVASQRVEDKLNETSPVSDDEIIQFDL
jgi:hypothetical protein